MKSTMSVLIPIIRKLTPTLVAQDIVGVQPMTGMSPYLKWDFTEKDGRWTSYYSPMGFEIGKLITWCEDTFGERGPDAKWNLVGGNLSFSDRKYVDWFLMKWGR